MPDTDIAKQSPNALDDDGFLTNEEVLSFNISATASSERLDRVLAGLMPEHSRSRLQGWITEGHVRLNGQVAKPRQLVGPGDCITVREQVPPESLAFSPEPIPLQVIDESPDWIVINKQAGLVTHPGAGNWQGTLLNGLLFRYPELTRVARAGIVHRLDKDTSGLLVVARNETAQTHLVRQLQARLVHRQYRALVHGRLENDTVYRDDIGRDPRVPVRMSTDRPIAPKQAVTHVQPSRHGLAEPGGPVSDIVCRLETGRTHQIRVHLSAHGHPLLGDTLYGGKAIAGALRQQLHATELAFDDPASGATVRFQAPVPDDFLAVLSAIHWEAE